MHKLHSATESAKARNEVSALHDFLLSLPHRPLFMRLESLLAHDRNENWLGDYTVAKEYSWEGEAEIAGVQTNQDTSRQIDMKNEND